MHNDVKDDDDGNNNYKRWKKPDLCMRYTEKAIRFASFYSTKFYNTHTYKTR